MKPQPDISCVKQRLFRVLLACISLEQSSIQVLERITLLGLTPELEDVASLTDRLHEVFNAYSFLTRCNGWHDVDDELEELQ